MKMRRIPFIFLVWLLNTSSTYASTDLRQHAKLEPPTGKILPIIGQSCEAIGGMEGQPSENSYYNHVVSQSPTLLPAAITLYGFLQYNRDGEPILAMNSCFYSLLNSARYSHTALHYSLGIKNVNPDIAAGIFDDAIIELAQYIKALNRPVYLRIGYEFDNPGHGNPDGKRYAQAFRRVVDVIRDQGVNNFATVFASTFKVQLPIITPSYEQYYPGNNYVDWVGFSYWGGPFLDVDLTPGMMAFARRKGKPVMIGESAPMFARLNNVWLNGFGFNKLWWNIFYARYFEFINDNSDIVRAFHYISEDWSRNNDLWRSTPIYYPFIDMNSQVHQNAYILQRWIDELNKTQYLKADDEWIH